MDSEALKPCPFCGGSVTIDDCGEGDLFVFLCKEGSSCIGSGFANYGLRSKKAEAITAWNTRADGNRIEALQADKAKLREAGYDALVALDSARAFILKKYGSKNPAREDAIAALFAALQETER